MVCFAAALGETWVRAALPPRSEMDGIGNERRIDDFPARTSPEERARTIDLLAIRLSCPCRNCRAPEIASACSRHYTLREMQQRLKGR